MVLGAVIGGIGSLLGGALSKPPSYNNTNENTNLNANQNQNSNNMASANQNTIQIANSSGGAGGPLNKEHYRHVAFMPGNRFQSKY